MIKVGIVGGAGYTAGELCRILINHPEAEINWVQSVSQNGKQISEIHKDLIGELDIEFSENPDWAIDVVFLCSGHGKSKGFIEDSNIPDSVKIIDMSSDFRLKATENNFIYGLPELNRMKIINSSHIANPGCFATCIQLALLPLAAASKLKEEVHVTAITGSTGAGVMPGATTHFSWRDSNISVYKAFEHQHLHEVKESLTQAQSEPSGNINFIPVRGNFTRGILASVYTRFNGEITLAEKLYEDYYEGHPFVHISQNNPDLKMVVNTNKAILNLSIHNGYLHIISIIDNLLKGASGQAVQNMNLIFGLNEATGLNLKSTAF